MLKATPCVTHIVEVEGTGRFPTDMLRYDMLAPCDSDAVSALTSDNREPRKIRLIRYATKAWMPTAGRWKSFGWHVVSQRVV